MTDWPILSTLVFFPLVGVFILAFIRDNTDIGKNNVFIVAILSSIFTFVISLFVYFGFDKSSTSFQMQEVLPWLGKGLSYHLGVDGISVLFIMLTTILIPFCILASKETIKDRMKAYMICFLILESMILGVFCSLNAVLFYVFFEGSLIPMFIIIGIWGGPRRVYASFKFFLYTLIGSVLMLVALMCMYFNAGTLDILDLLQYHFPVHMQYWLWVAFFASFAVKMPMWPFHTWLPDAHVEAPTAGSVVLAGIMLKLGGYGFLRFSLPMFPHASTALASFVFALSVIAIIYTSLVALVQKDIKKLIAYSSVAHMAYVTIGIFAVNENSIDGAIFQMISHGFVSSGLFLCVGVIYDRLHTREIAAFGGLAKNMPLYAVVFLILTMANVGLPGTSGFIGEFLPLIGVYKVNSFVAVLSTTGVILSASYALLLYRRIAFGRLDKEDVKLLPDLSLREKFLLYPMVGMSIYLGIYPNVIINTISAPVKLLINNIH